MIVFSRKYLILYFNILSAIFLTLQASSQNFISVADSITQLSKSNTFQIADYKPYKAERFIIHLGRYGKEGKQGPELKVEITAIAIGDSTYLKVIVKKKDSKSKHRIYFINPNIGQLKIIADGGDGGDGESSKKGGGYGGDGGNGGIIEVTFDAATKKYLVNNCLLFSIEGGLGGIGGLDTELNSHASDGDSGKKGKVLINGLLSEYDSIYYKTENR